MAAGVGTPAREVGEWRGARIICVVRFHEEAWNRDRLTLVRNQSFAAFAASAAKCPPRPNRRLSLRDRSDDVFQASQQVIVCENVHHIGVFAFDDLQVEHLT